MDKKITKEYLQVLKVNFAREIKKLKRRIEELKKQDPFSDPEHSIDNAAIDTDVREQVGHDTIEAQVKRLRKEVSNMEHAFGKIDKGRYGVCESCGKAIPFPRLKIIPQARFCIECETRLVK